MREVVCTPEKYSMFRTSDSDRLTDVSIIIPVAPGDSSWRQLLPDLQPVSPRAEVILAAAESPPPDFQMFVEHNRLPPVLWIEASRGRARQLNAGAARASRRFLWFLHADTRVTTAAIETLEHSLSIASDVLHYFDLTFLNDGPPLVRLNAWGARLRSRVFQMPFGDQGFCLSRELFERLGRFDETAACGEDHLLVWTARRQRVPLRCTKAALSTSARRYRDRGWPRTTFRHAVLTWRQALPQAWLLLKERACPRRTRHPQSPSS